jgi:hypothetical protein
VLKAQNALTIELLFDGERRACRSGTAPTTRSRHYVTLAKGDGSLATLKTMLLVDMIGDRDLRMRRDANSTPWLTDIVWREAKRLRLDDHFIADSTKVEDDHLPFLAAGVPSVDIIDLDYEPWAPPPRYARAVSAKPSGGRATGPRGAAGNRKTRRRPGPARQVDRLNARRHCV